MNRKAYVRVTERFTHLAEPIEVIVGVQLENHLTLAFQYTKLRGVMKVALTPTALNNYADDTLAAAVELAIQNHYPLRPSYFIEVGRGDMDQYVQVFEVGE